MPQPRIVPTRTRLAFEQRALAEMSRAIVGAIHTHGSCVVGLSGGSTPGPIYRLLREHEGIDWSKVTIFLVDERYVPAESEDSNQFLLRETLLASHQLDDHQMVFPDTSLPLADCVEDYDRRIAALPHIHLVILGMGEDGHIASLFPPLTREANGPSRAIHTRTERFKVHDRISVTLPVLQSADERLFLISGTAKVDLLEKMQREATDITQFPAQALMEGRTVWVVGTGQ